MLEKLLGSEARVKILNLFLLNAGSEYYLREIAQRTGLAVRSVQRTAKDLTDIGILHRERRGNSVYFRLNGGNPIVPDLKAIFLKTIGLGDQVRERLTGESKIDAAFIYGSVAKGDETATSDIDLAMIGDLPPQTLTGLLEDLERVTGRDVNATVFTRAEWKARIESGEHFVTTLLREPKIMLLGLDAELGALGRVTDD